MSTLLEVKNFQKDFTIHHLDKTFTAVEDISFSVDEGGFLGIVGKSGSGKSTIIKCIYRSYLPSEGELIYQSDKFGEIDLATADERTMIYLRQYEIAYVSQFLQVMPRTTSFEIVRNSLLEMDVSEKEAEEQARDVLQHFEIPEELWDSYPKTFSGGEKLRLNIASAIVKRPKLLLLDEPTASLDDASKVKVHQAIEKLKAEGTTMIGIFHDIEFMEDLTDDVYDMNTRSLQEEV